MRHYILASHAYYSKGIVSALEMIIGEQNNLSFYCAYTENEGDDNEHFKDKLVRELRGYSEQDDVVIMTDLFGGSVNNELLELCRKPNVHLVTGINLILVLSLLISSEQEPIDEAIKRLIDEARSGMVYCNDLEVDEETSIEEF